MPTPSGGTSGPIVVTVNGVAQDVQVESRLLLVHLLRENLRQGGVLGALGAGCVLTGGGARLPGLLDVAESLLRVPARLGYPVPLSRMPDELIQPEFSFYKGLTPTASYLIQKAL